MENEKSSNGAIATGVIAAIAASSCCIPPVIAAISGISGASANLSWMEPFRPYLIGLTIITIGYAWYANLKPKKKDDCGCEIIKPKFYQTKSFLISMTILAGLSIALPYYSGVFFPVESKKNLLDVLAENQVKVSYTIEGMTCESCEHHISSALLSAEGVIEVIASYEQKTASVVFDNSKTSSRQLIKVLEKETGYKVISEQIVK